MKESKLLHFFYIISSLILLGGPGSRSGKALDYGLDGPGVGGVEIFLHSFMSKLILGSTQPPINEYRGPPWE